MATFPGFEDWARQNGVTRRTGGDDGDNGESRYSRGAEGKYYAEKYGLAPMASPYYSFGPTQGIDGAEDLFNAMATGVKGSNLPIMNLSPERREQIIRGALGGGQTFGGLNFDSQMTPQELAAVEQYRAYEGESWGDTLKPFAGMAAMVAGAYGLSELGFAGAGLGETAGAFGGDFAGTAALAEGGLGAGYTATAGLPTTGGDMGFFSDILGGEFTSIFDAGGTMTGAFDFGNPTITAATEMTPGLAGEAPWWGNIPSAESEWLSQPFYSGGSNSFFDDLGWKDVASLGKSALSLGDSALSGAQNLWKFLGGDNAFGKALSAGPSLAALAYANNQGDLDTSRLESLYDDYNPEASAFEYDQNTATGRRNLNDSLTSRGVMGSSFGSYDMNSFNTNRELGRESLINQSAGNAANIANMILSADIKNRAIKNDLVGRALTGISGGLAGKSVFGGGG